ncbi:iron hydroxylase [Pseudomonas sp. PIC25]|uniref:TauD/TfdA family dioxygenase n=1 Tax=Pseudomonas sp. PIC25 TaxID=1958773 RepID=UPI000BABB889|nr:TauD/TfdA family dioxygenase [Pseudomonas sp. PIC25]PAU52553.1 iron hydroxylase [Pseudomonas sp. PIC25]
MSDIKGLLVSSIANGGLHQDHISKIITFRQFGNEQGYLLLENMPIGRIPPTPRDRRLIGKHDNQSERLILQTTALLGEPIGYVQESNGNIVNNFFPHKQHSRKKTSDSYDTELDLHTENAFHAVQPDYLVLLCLRQDPGSEAITYISSIEHIRQHLTPDCLDFFFTEKYNFLSDYCPNGKNCRLDIGKNQTVLYGDPADPMFRFDPQFMVARNGYAQYQMTRLRDIAWREARPIKLRAGDLLIIDNRKTAHARSAFSARFDGTDRWLQRTFVVCNHRYYTEKLGRSTRVFDLVANL